MQSTIVNNRTPEQLTLHTTMNKAGRKRKADGRVVKSASDARLSFRDSLYSEKAAAMIESKSEPSSATSTGSTSPKDDVPMGAFQFVDQSASSRREARRFVMRRSVWHRKQEQTKRLQGKASTREVQSASHLAWTRPQASASTSPELTDKKMPPKLTIDTHTPRSVLPYDPVRSAACSSPADSSPSAFSVSSAGRKDSFDSAAAKTESWKPVDFFQTGYRPAPQPINNLRSPVWQPSQSWAAPYAPRPIATL